MLSQNKYDHLCDRLINRDPQVIAELIDIYGDAIYGAILRLVKLESVAQEVFQDTFTKVWQKGDSYNPDAGRIYTWIMRIARNNSLNYLHSKAAKKSQKIQGDEKLVYMSDHARCADSMECCDMKGAIAQLDQKYAMIIEHIYYRGYTHQELSDEYNIPIGTIKSRIKIGLRELKKIYDFKLSQVVIVLFGMMFYTL